MIKRIVISAMLALSAVCQIQGQEYQNAPVTVSTDKIRLDGKVYYYHIVREKQTVYSICKAYNISQEELEKANPALKANGLKADSVLYIPVDETPAKQVSTQHQEPQKPAATQKPVNPQTEQKKQEPQKPAAAEKPVSPQPEQEVKKPVLETVTEAVSDVKDEVRTHIVKWYEDLDAIARKYKVSIQELMAANGLKDKKLTPKQELRIPERSSTPVAVQSTYSAAGNAGQNASYEAPEPTYNTSEGEEASIGDGFRSLFNMKRKVNMMLLLPLKAGSAGGNSNYMDFYGGALVAARDRGLDGYEVDLKVYDIAGGIPTFSEESLAETDIVIGPVSSADMKSFLLNIPSRIPVVSPMDPKCEPFISGHTSFIQAPTSQAGQYEDLAGWIKEDKQTGDKVIVVYEKGSRDVAESSDVNTALKASGLDYSVFSYSIGDGGASARMQAAMTRTGCNRVLVASEKESFVSDALRNLNIVKHAKFDVVLYGGSKLKGFDNVEIDNMHNTDLHMSLSYYVDYDDPAVKSFILKYRALYGAEPNAFAFQGYDLTSYFIDVMARHPENWKRYICNSKVKMLQASFRFAGGSGEDDGFYNKGVRRIVYGPDYEIRNAD